MRADSARVWPPQGSSDAFMTPYHVKRGELFVRERFADNAVVDVELVSQCIAMTRFPVPHRGGYVATDDLPGLVRASDLIGQMADPQYLQKLSRLFAEFTETGEANHLGFKNVGALRSSFPKFFYSQVQPYISEGIACLKRTQEGRHWIADLYHYLQVNNSHQEFDPKVRAPEFVVNNTPLS